MRSTVLKNPPCFEQKTTPRHWPMAVACGRSHSAVLAKPLGRSGNFPVILGSKVDENGCDVDDRMNKHLQLYNYIIIHILKHLKVLLGTNIVL